MQNSWRWWVVIVTVLGGCLYALSGVLLPFVAGMVVAYFLNPLVERLGLSRAVSALIILLIFFSAAGLAVMALIPRIETEIIDAFAHVPEYRHSLELRFGPLLDQVMGMLSAQDMTRLQGALGGQVGAVAGWVLALLGRVLRGGLAVMDVLSLLFIMPIVTFYLLRDWDRLVDKVESWLPRDHAPLIRTCLAQLDQTLSAFVRGQALVCLVMGSYYGLALTVAGVDLGLVIGIFTGLFSFVPYLGMLSGLMVAVGVALAQTGSWGLPASVAAIFAIGHLTESNVLTPRLVGDRIGLHPLWIMFALMAGGALVGLVGMLLAVPVAAMIGVVLRQLMDGYLQSSLYQGTERHDV